MLSSFFSLKKKQTTPKKLLGPSMPHFILYQDGTMSTVTSIQNLPTMILKPLFQKGLDKDVMELEIHFPHGQIDTNSVQLLIGDELDPLLPLKQYSFLDDSSHIPRIRFVFPKDIPQQLPLEDIQVMYVDTHPGLQWSCFYELKLSSAKDSLVIKEHPSVVQASLLKCSIQFTNETDKTIGPGTFQIVLRNTDQESLPSVSYARRARQPSKARHTRDAEAMERKEKGNIHMLEATPPPAALSAPDLESNTVNIENSESSSLTLPSITQFGKLSTTKIVVAMLTHLQVRKVHSWKIKQWDQLETGLADLTYECLPLGEDSEWVNLPAGVLHLYSGAVKQIATFHVSRIQRNKKIKLKGSVDNRIHIQSHVDLKHLQVDQKGNYVTVYTGGVSVESNYDSPFDLSIYVPLDTPHVQVRDLKGVKGWKHEPHQSRLVLRASIQQPKQFVSFVVIGSEAIQVDRRTTNIDLHLLEKIKSMV
jgi:hypothetical protein